MLKSYIEILATFLQNYYLSISYPTLFPHINQQSIIVAILQSYSLLVNIKCRLKNSSNTIMLFIHFVIQTIIYQLANTEPLEVQVWTEPGQYYGHFCEISFLVISSTFSNPEQCFYITTMENLELWDYDHPSLISDNNRDKQYLNVNKIHPCNVGKTSKFYCMWVEPIFIGIGNIPIKQIYNSTHNSYLFRLLKAVCPPNHLNNKIKIKIQVPATIKSRVPSPQIRVSQQYSFELSNLTYRQIDNIETLQANKYLKGYLTSFTFSINLKNASLVTEWSQIILKFQQPNPIVVKNCLPNCIISKNSDVVFTNNNFRDLIPKQYSYVSNQIYFTQPIPLNFNINLTFAQVGSFKYQIIITSTSSRYSQQFKTINKTQPYFQYFGYKSQLIYAYPLDQFINLPKNQRNLPYNYQLILKPTQTNTTTPTNNTNTTTTPINNTNTTTTMNNTNATIPTNDINTTNPQNNTSNNNDPLNNTNTSGNNNSEQIPIMIEQNPLITELKYFWIQLGVLCIIFVLTFKRTSLMKFQLYIYSVVIALSWLVKVLFAYLQQDETKLVMKLFIIIGFMLHFVLFFIYGLFFCQSPQLSKKMRNKSVLLHFGLLVVNFKFFGVFLIQFLGKKNKKFKNKSHYLIHSIHLIISILWISSETTWSILKLIQFTSLIRLIYLTILIIQTYFTFLMLNNIIFISKSINNSRPINNHNNSHYNDNHNNNHNNNNHQNAQQMVYKSILQMKITQALTPSQLKISETNDYL